jgi:hypothetical protein
MACPHVRVRPPICISPHVLTHRSLCPHVCTCRSPMSSCMRPSLAYVLMHAPVTRLCPHAHALATRLCPHVRPSLLLGMFPSSYLCPDKPDYSYLRKLFCDLFTCEVRVISLTVHLLIVASTPSLPSHSPRFDNKPDYSYLCKLLRALSTCEVRIFSSLICLPHPPGPSLPPKVLLRDGRRLVWSQQAKFEVSPCRLQTRLASGWLNLPPPIMIATERGTHIVLNALLTAIIEPFHPRLSSFSPLSSLSSQLCSPFPAKALLAAAAHFEVSPCRLRTRLASGWLNLPLPIVITTERGTHIVLNALLTAIIEPFHPRLSSSSSPLSSLSLQLCSPFPAKALLAAAVHLGTPLPMGFGVFSRPSGLKLLLPVREILHCAKWTSHAVRPRSLPVHRVVLLGLVLYSLRHVLLVWHRRPSNLLLFRL